MKSGIFHDVRLKEKYSGLKRCSAAVTVVGTEENENGE